MLPQDSQVYHGHVGLLVYFVYLVINKCLAYV